MARSHGTQVGIEAKIEDHRALEILGACYESWRRTAVSWLQSGLTEDAVEKRLQSEFNIDWAWADYIPRTRLFQWTKALEGILTVLPGAAEHPPSSSVDIETGESSNPHQSPMGEARHIGNVQSCLGF